MTASRIIVRFALGFALLVAIAILIAMTRGNGLQPINSHDRLPTTSHALAPASLDESRAPAIYDGGTMGEKTTLTPSGSTNASTIAGGAASAPGTGRPADIVTRAGPTDTALGYSAQIQPQSCTQKPCMHVGR